MSNKLKYKFTPLNTFSLFLIGYSIYYFMNNDPLFGIRDLIVLVLIITSVVFFVLDLFLQKITLKYLKLFILELIIVAFIVFTFIIQSRNTSSKLYFQDSKDLIIKVK